MSTSVMNSVSARNQISGRITDIQQGAAITIATLSANGITIVSAITNQAAQDLGLKKNDAVVALVKSTEAIIAKGDVSAMKISARNKVSGRVEEVKKGSAMGSVSIDAGQLKITAAITRQAIDDLQLIPGDQVTAFFKATEVMLQKAA
ncbi:MAG TPA: TOBE domain-containing protein [Nitrospiraceae bacterium]|nr:TOBE domain-containing protein [Nitrospiraceae bacterium]